ncbi:DUF6090 family protein [Gramella sp. KN1008]|uniref:DUF6090 family protein n=1 Tax=Gramella sp. KN1008 TaxID=2529298 RepID=UPI001040A80B|nr:DUF6090 family protein [Gramella sp. KN1008]TBW28304.1 hypothetical protein EZJ28_06040 [Gramella sp. KN1008]
MIKFFRNIRHKLLRENRFTRYLIYAVGEIILVVIGILIALQINNWNEARKESMREKKLLSNLNEEFRDNLQDLDSIGTEVNKVIQSLEKVFGLFDQTPENVNNDSLDLWLSRALSSPNWKPSDYLLNNLNSSGSITELKNEKLKLLLYKWARQHNEMIEVQQRTERTGEEIIAHLKEYGSLRNVDVAGENFEYPKSRLVVNNQKLLADPRFENHIDDKLYMYRTTRTWLKRARKTILELIEETKT